MRVLSGIFLLIAVQAGQNAFAQTQDLSASSPFLAAGADAAPVANSEGRYELVGMIATSKQTLVGLTDKTAHRSFWVPAGKTAEGVEVVSCDPKQDRAVIKVDGVVQALAMHASSPNGVASLPHAAPLAVPPPPASTGVQAQQEQEARMLVSDLLEISQQQRKAYEQSKKNGPASPSPSPTPVAR